MTIDLALEALSSAKEAVLSALTASSPPLESHLLYEAPHRRHNAKTRLEAHDGDIQRVCDKFDSVLRSGLSALCAMRAQLHGILAPVRCLPPELLSHIFELALDGPQDRRNIMNLSHVCGAWRSCIHDISSLYTMADWNRWPSSACLEWSLRAQARSLSIKIHDRGLQRFLTISSSDVLDAVEATKGAWGALLYEAGQYTSSKPLN